MLFVLYNKAISKIDIVQDIVKGTASSSGKQSYFLCDCWYVSEKIINTFAVQRISYHWCFETNRLLYPSGMKKKLSELATELSVTHKTLTLYDS